jgi:hypothetical protein
VAVVTIGHGSGLCIRIEAPDVEMLDGAHWPAAAPETFRELAEATERQPPLTLVLMAEPCRFLTCDGCEEDAEDDGRHLHFESLEELQGWAKLNNWTTDGRRFWCDGCSGDPPPVERIPVLPGQLALEDA